jgi:hypothetical protein
MATDLHRVRQNFEWVIGKITPTNRTPGQDFTLIDPTEDMPEDADHSGGLREFFVQRLVGEEDIGATDLDRREAWHEYEVHISYPVAYPFGTMHDIISQDLHDLKKALRDQSNRSGYSTAEPAASIGLYKRVCAGDELLMDDEDFKLPWELVMLWRCKIREEE